MSMSRHRSVVVPLLSALLLLLAVPLAAQETAPAAGSPAIAQAISPEAQAVLDRMTAFLKTQKTLRRI